MIEIPLLMLDQSLPIPTYAKDGDAGLDLYARQSLLLEPGARGLVPTGVALQIPLGYAGFILPRSGLAIKHGITCLNSPGLIDSGYRDELIIILANTDLEHSYQIERGDRIAQLVVQAVEQVEFIQVESLSESTRGSGRFGHSGK